MHINSSLKLELELEMQAQDTRGLYGQSLWWINGDIDLEI